MQIIARILFAALLLAFSTSPLSAQLSGKVLDENGQPLAFASIYVRNSTIGTVANTSGEFKLALDKGRHEIVFHYIGYRQKIETVTIADKPVRLTIQLEPSNLEIQEVVITTEDPAYRIIRQAIEKREYYRRRVTDYTCDAYVKGFYKLTDAPEKILGEEVGDMGGVLDTNRAGVIYLSESVSKVYRQGEPPRTKEIMISSKVSGSNSGFSPNRASLVDFNLYDERINIDRDILSPLADNAFSYYRYKLLGKFQDENGYNIYKIEVIPKRKEDPTYSGVLYIVDEWFNLSGVDLVLTGSAIKQPIIDTLRIQQSFVPVEAPDGWVLLNQIMGLKFAVFGFKIGGFFNSVFSNYDIKPKFENKFFNRETFRIEDKANERDSTYWAAIRPIPLTPEEVRDYVRKDSLERIWNSDAYRDSMDRKGNKFRPNNLLYGYSWENSKKHIRIGYPPAAGWVQFNTVQGWLVNIQPSYRRDADERATRYLRLEGTINYGFSEKRLRGGLSLQRKFESIQYKTLSLDAGIATEQFNPERPVTTVINDVYSLWAQRNYLKLFEQAYASAGWSQRLSWLLLRAEAGFFERRPLVNHSDYTLYRRNDRIYTPNAPVFETPPYEPFFEKHRAMIVRLDARLRLNQTYSSYPKVRAYDSYDLPELWLRYRKAIPGIAQSVVNYDLLQAEIRQYNLSAGLFGYTSWSLAGGIFLNRERVEYMDLYQPIGNQTIFGRPRNYQNSFFLLPFYGYGTDRAYAEFHLQHHLQGWLLDKLPLLRKLNLKEVVGFNAYYAETSRGEGVFTENLPYWEFNVGLENIGIGFFRPFRIDVATGFFGDKRHRTGVVIGINL